ncbi:MAG: NADH-quinone oxidoreductase subunit C [Puniceicoccales bacterium]
MSDLLESLKPRFEGLEPRKSSDHPAIQCPVDLILPLIECLRDEFTYTLLCDVTAIDWDQDSPRFSVVYHLYSIQESRYVRVVTNCLDDENPSVPSVVALFPGANWHERETYDMFGIRFEGHPDLRRILMWEEYPYHPLRKEFPLAGIETDLPDSEVGEETQAKVLPAPMMGGPFVAKDGAPMSRAEPRAKDQSWTEWKKKTALEDGDE